jgi:hypothetical protein
VKIAVQNHRAQPPVEGCTTIFTARTRGWHSLPNSPVDGEPRPVIHRWPSGHGGLACGIAIIDAVPHPASITNSPSARHATADAALAALAASQYGAFTRGQAVQSGLSRAQIVARLASGIWIPLHPGVMIASTTPRTAATRAIAGLLYAGERAWFSHSTAARLRGIDPQLADPRSWITVPMGVVRSSQPGLAIARSRRITGFTDMAHGFPTLNDARTIVDLARIVNDVTMTRILYDVVSRGVVTIDSVLAAAEDFGGRVGIAMLRRVATGFTPELESGLEFEADVVFQRAGIDLEPQYEVREGPLLIARLDFADPAVMVGIEIDGHRFHSTQAASRYDRQRDRMLRRRGWQIERFTTEDVRRTPNSMVQHVRALLARAAEQRPLAS